MSASVINLRDYNFIPNDEKKAAIVVYISTKQSVTS